MRRATFWLLLSLLSSLTALEGQLSMGHLGPLNGVPLMLERRFFEGSLKSANFWSAALALEQRSWQDLYQESRLTAIPSFAWLYWQAGVGLHYRSIQLPQLKVDYQQTQLALRASWNTPNFLLRGFYVSQDFLEAEAAFLADFFVPLEWNFSYRRDDGFFDGSRLSLLAYLNSHAGAGIRYFAKAETISVRGWLKPLDSLVVRFEYYLPSALRPVSAFELVLEYRFGSSWQRYQRLPHRSAAVLEESPQQVAQRERSIAQKKKPAVPSYVVMLRRGVAPLEALSLVRSNDLCQASPKTRRLLGVAEESCLP